MELMQETDDISCREEEEEEEEEITRNTREESSSKNHHHHYNSPFSSPSLSLSSSPSTTTTTNHHAINNIPPHQQQIPWFNMNIPDHHQNSPESHNSSSGLGLKQLDFMELSLGNNKDDPSTSAVDPSTSSSANQVQVEAIEKEHMFDKVVTPSDVGKLNRLVIPKQHAEKYFPLDSTTNEKGLLLNFEDRNGKLWRFRYSYWNSSQSYVMTKGWSRFVKEKKLDAGDIVSFQRGVGELYRHRLYIDWRRRSNHHHIDPSTTLFTPFFLPNPNQPPHYSMIRWGAATPATTARLYSTSPHTSRHYNYHMYHPFNQQQNHAIGGSGSGNRSQYNYYNELSSSSSSSSSAAAAGYYMRSSSAAGTSMPIFSDVQRQQEGRGFGGANISLSPMIIDSVPVAHHHHHHHSHYQQQQYGGNKSGSNSAAKRLRLFGVNMECGSSTNEDTKSIPSTSSSSLQPHQHEDTLSVSPSTTRFGDQREETASMLFDLDPSLQYRQ